MRCKPSATAGLDELRRIESGRRRVHQLQAAWGEVGGLSQGGLLDLELVTEMVTALSAETRGLPTVMPRK